MPSTGGGYAEKFREKLGRTVHPTEGPVRAGADALPSRSLGGPYIPGNMSNLNPTIGATAPFNSIPPNRPDIYLSSAPGGHSESIMAQMAAMAALMSGYPGPEVHGLPESPAPSPGLGMGTPAPITYEDQSYGYPGSQGDPLLMLMQVLLNQRFPNGG